MEELFFKPIMESINNMDKFEQKEMKKIIPVKNTWLINYILDSIRESIGCFKDKL